jgi:hypothetical protein
MAPPERDETTLRRFLLRTLPDEQRAALETEALRDDGVFEDLQAVEDDLFHDYARGALSDGERRDFERTLLRTPDGPRRLADAQALVVRLDAAPAPGSVSAVRWSAPAWLAAAAVLIALAAAWLLGRPAAPPQQAQQPAPPPTAVPTGSAPPVPQASPSAAPAATRIVSLALAPGMLRGSPGPVPRVTVTGDVGRLRLVLALPAENRARAYDALLRTAEGRTVWKSSGLRGDAGGGTVSMELPAPALPEGDYELVLERRTEGGPEPVADYRFRLLRD